MTDINNDQKDWKEQKVDGAEKSVTEHRSDNTTLNGFSTVSEFTARAAKLSKHDFILDQFLDPEQGDAPDLDLDYERPR